MLGSLKLTERKLGKEVSLESVLSPSEPKQTFKRSIYSQKYDNISTWYFRMACCLGLPEHFHLIPAILVCLV